MYCTILNFYFAKCNFKKGRFDIKIETLYFDSINYVVVQVTIDFANKKEYFILETDRDQSLRLDSKERRRYKI